MAILLTNDDGIDAPGLAALVDALAGIDDLYVSAPATNQSGVGTCISIGRELTVRRHPDGPGGARRHSIAGTPSDAVKYGLQHMLPVRPRLVVAGINHGQNIGRNLRCSGTVSAAFEGMGSGLPAVAVSLEYTPTPIWDGAKFYARLVVEKALQLAESGESPFLLNLNVPSRPPEEIPGLVAVRHGLGGIRDILTPRVPGDTFYMAGELIAMSADGDCDGAALEAGYAVITPMQYDMTDHRILREMRRDWQDLLVEHPGAQCRTQTQAGRQ